MRQCRYRLSSIDMILLTRTHTLRSMYSTNKILATSLHTWIALIMMLWNRKILGLWPHVSSLSLVNVPVVQRVLAVLTFIYQFLNNKTFKETFVDGLTFSSPEPFLSPFSRVSSTQKINTLPKNFYVKILQMIQPGWLLFNSQWPLFHTTLFKHKMSSPTGQVLGSFDYRGNSSILIILQSFLLIYWKCTVELSVIYS